MKFFVCDLNKIKQTSKVARYVNIKNRKVSSKIILYATAYKIIYITLTQFECDSIQESLANARQARATAVCV